MMMMSFKRPETIKFFNPFHFSICSWFQGHSRFHDDRLLLKMVWFAYRKLKAI